MGKTSETNFEVFIAVMGTASNGDMLLQDSTEEELADPKWSVWVMQYGPKEDDAEEVSDEDFPIDQRGTALNRAYELCEHYDAGFTEL